MELYNLHTKLMLLTLLISSVLALNKDDETSSDIENKAREFMKKFNELSEELSHKMSLVSWAYDSNITDYNQDEMTKQSMIAANFTKEWWNKTIKFPWQTFQDPDLKRQFKLSSVLGTAILAEDKFDKYTNITNVMQSIYGKAKVCQYNNPKNCTISLEPELSDIFANSRDPEELKYYWTEWRKITGKECRPMYKDYVDLSNEAAKLNNFTTSAESWLEPYESDEFESDVKQLWKDVEPLYKELHAYVRYKLRQLYGDLVPDSGGIPAHLLGNMWAEEWSHIYNISVPYPDKPSPDVTENLKKGGYTPLQMFKISEEFQMSLNLSAIPPSFWENSIIEKPKDDRDLICHASSWDFSDGKDYRIKMCAVVNMEDLLVIHHEMGHTQYYLQYRNQPHIYREGANPGFHEAVGDTLALSVVTPKHLRKINLLDKNYQEDEESNINFLFLSALSKVAFVPYGLLLDTWRWAIFRGEILPENYNCKYWDLRWKLQGVESPVDRSEEDFDPGAKYHIAADASYISYFVSYIIQFQFYKAMCIKAGQYDPSNPKEKPLHTCDFYQSAEAGNALARMLKMGSSKPWPDAMEVITGQRKMDSSALLEYFAPLYDWLKTENKKNGVVVGWENAKPQKSCK